MASTLTSVCSVASPPSLKSFFCISEIYNLSASVLLLSDICQLNILSCFKRYPLQMNTLLLRFWFCFLTERTSFLKRKGVFRFPFRLNISAVLILQLSLISDSDDRSSCPDSEVRSHKTVPVTQNPENLNCTLDCTSSLLYSVPTGPRSGIASNDSNFYTACLKLFLVLNAFCPFLFIFNS